MSAKEGHKWRRRAHGVLSAVVILGAAFFLWRQHAQLEHAMALFSRLKWRWVGLAVAAEVVALVSFAGTQYTLLRAADSRIPLWRMVRITLAANSIALSIPGGAAVAAAFAFDKMKSHGVSKEVSAGVVLVAGAASGVALFLLAVVGIETAGGHGPARGLRGVAAALVVLLVVIVISAGLGLRSGAVGRSVEAAGRVIADRHLLPKAASDAVGRAWERIQAIHTRPAPGAVAFVTASANWLGDAACLAAAVTAVGAHVPWSGLLVAYVVAQIGISLPVTPGGVGIVEGALTYALIAYGVGPREAVAGMIVYRVISFWALVPLGLGAWVSMKGARSEGRGDAETCMAAP